MSEDRDRIRKAAEKEGYELAHSQESWGRTFFGLFIFVKMSERKLDPDKDWLALNRGAEEIKKGLETVSAQLDPKGPENRKAYRDEIELIYKEAGVTAIFMEELPNGYCSQPCCLNKPWFRVTSSIGHVVIGWRKRVISIVWKDTNIKKTGEEMFPTEASTRWETGIHAWGTGPAVEYIKKLHDPIQ